MAYSQFTLKDVQKAFQLDIKEEMGIFAHIEPIQILNYYYNDSRASALNYEHCS